MRKLKLSLEQLPIFVSLVAIFGVGCSGNDSGAKAACKDTIVAAESQALTGDSARLLLSPKLLTRLRQRAAAKDGAWLELKQACDGWLPAAINPPSGPAYGTPPLIAAGYMGEEYVPVVLSLALCYRTLADSDAASAQKYASKGAQVLEAMSTPPSAGGAQPSANSGYAIRNYGVGMALAYDWLRPTLSATLKQRVASTLGEWIGWYDQSGFLKDDPIANYFVGYFEAKTMAALAIEGDAPAASTWLADVQSRLWEKHVKPRYSSYLAGGGWPEGWGYGPLAVRGIAEVLWAVKTAKNLDWAAALPQVREQAAYVSHFAWPALNRMDDQGTIRSGNKLAPSALLATALATALSELGDAAAGRAASFADAVIAAGKDDRKPWQKFLYWDPALPKSSYTTDKPSYFARGPSHVAMRSSWDKSAVWSAFSGGSYINAHDSGEQLFNAGNFTIVSGSSPLLVNATGWIPFTADTPGETFVYTDSWGGGGRRLHNTFYVDDASNYYNPGQNSAGPDQSSAKVDVFEEGDSYVRSRATGLEDQYGLPGQSHPVLSFTRDFVYVRPGTFVVHDDTLVASASADQWMAFHTPSAPQAVTPSDASQRRFDLPSVGSIRTLLPQAVAAKTVALPGGTTRIEAHAPTKDAAQKWLSVVSASADAPEMIRLSKADGNVPSGELVGVEVLAPENQVVLFAADSMAAPTNATYSVHPTADAEHLIVGLAAGGRYSVKAQAASGGLTVTLSTDGALEASASGVLRFGLSKSGEVEVIAPPPPANTHSGGSPNGEEPCSARCGDDPAPPQRERTSTGCP